VAVDVASEIVIRRPREQVAAFAGRLDNAPQWHVDIESMEWKTSPPMRVGSQVVFIAHFLGRRLIYTYEIVEMVAGERLVMRTAAGPFPMETSYTWQSITAGSTRMTLRNRGNPTGFAKLVAPFTTAAMRKANQKDLARLKSILESS
jgi:hypothetical protein